MKIQRFAIFLAVLASPSWASHTASTNYRGSLFLDAESTREKCGVGNYVFRHLVDHCGTTASADARDYEEAMTITQSSALAAPAENDTLLFPTDSARLTEAQKENIEKVAETLRMDRDRKVELQGNADAIGTAAYNDDLSRRRAESVMKELRRQGVRESQISIRAYGENNPVAGNDSAEGRSQNRRTDIILQ